MKSLLLPFVSALKITQGRALSLSLHGTSDDKPRLAVQHETAGRIAASCCTTIFACYESQSTA